MQKAMRERRLSFKEVVNEAIIADWLLRHRATIDLPTP